MTKNESLTVSTCRWRMSKWYIIPASWKGKPLINCSFCTASPQWRVVELDPQQVPHAGLGRVVNDELVVEEGVTAVFTHPCLHPRPHWHCDTIPETERGGHILIQMILTHLSTNGIAFTLLLTEYTKFLDRCSTPQIIYWFLLCNSWVQLNQCLACMKCISVMRQTHSVTEFLGSGPVCPRPLVLCLPAGSLLAS